MTASYAAEMFRAGSGARAVSGTLIVGHDHLRFSPTDVAGDEAAELVLPTQGLGCRLSGYDNRTFFFTHPSVEGAEVAVKDPSIAADPVLDGHTVFQEARRVGQATHRRFWGCLALLALGALVLLGTVGTVAALLLRWVIAG